MNPSASTQAPAAAIPCGAPLPGIAGTAMAAPVSARVAVFGASGYSGAEFVRLALDHPGLELAALVSREAAGRTAADLLPGLDLRAGSLPPVVDEAGLATQLESGAVDTVVAALPHGAWAEAVARQPALAAAPRRVVDLSADHRDGRGGYVYGLPEAFRAEVLAAARVANPGCYPTACALSLLPAAAAGLLAGPVTVTALSGVSGAGRSAQLRTSFVELDGGAAYYKVGTVHQHVPEMERTLARLAGGAGGAGGADGPAVAFAPQLVPMTRGILLTAQVALARAVTPEEAHALYAVRYTDEPFVRVLAPGHWPETRAVRGSNRADVQVTTLFGGRTLLATAAIDNLGKGAASQAVQNLNLMLGWPETTGLARHGSPW